MKSKASSIEVGRNGTAFMPRLADLSTVLIECRMLTKDQWDRAAASSGGELDQILANLAEEPPIWWDGKSPTPSGLTDYQRNMIQSRFAASELDYLGRDLAINQFLLLEKLGQGGQGEVYRGRQLNPPRFAAVKTLIRDTAIRRQRFEQEARSMMKIQHSAVARFYLYERVRDSSGEPTNEYLIAMELVSGTPLHRLVRSSGKIEWQFAVHWIIELLGGLESIHRHGFVHRDVKPENVMIVGPTADPETRPEATNAKLLDFGAVTRTGAGLDEGPNGNVFIGTMEYAPPEQWTGEVVGASDFYALGGTLFNMLTGRTPYQKTRRDQTAYRNAHRNEAIPDIRAFNAQIPQSVNRVFQKMLAKNPEDRGTAAELIAEFREILPAPVKASRASTTPTPPRPKPTPVAASKPSVSANPSQTKQLHNRERRLSDTILAVFERMFIPGHLRPRPGQEPATHERILALLRRPPVLVMLAAGLLLVIFWILRATVG